MDKFADLLEGLLFFTAWTFIVIFLLMFWGALLFGVGLAIYKIFAG